MIADKTFQSYLLAYRNFSQSHSFHYDFSGNFLFIPQERLRPVELCEVLHEHVHAQLGSSVLGITLQTLAECAAVVEKEIIGHIHPILRRLKQVDPTQAKLADEILLRGEPHARPNEARESENVVLWRAALHENLRSIAAWKPLTMAFQRLRGRAEAILRAWRPMHEGLAIVTTIKYLSAESEDSIAWRKRLIEYYAAKWDAPFSDTIFEQLTVVAHCEQDRYERGFLCDPVYLNGYRLCRQVYQLAGISGLWLASAVASHIPYATINLMDSSDEEFCSWFSGGPFDFTERMNRIIADRLTLKAATDVLDSANVITAETSAALLTVANGGHERTVLSPEMVNLWTWERQMMWRSQVMESVWRATNRGPSESFIPDSLPGLDDDRTQDFRFPGEWLPPTIFTDGNIVAVNAAEVIQARRRFVHAYEVERTARILNWLSADMH